MVAEKMHCRSAVVDTGRPSSVRSPSRHPRPAGASFIGMTMPQTAREVAPWVEKAARIGYVAKALLYATVGILAAQAALGRGGRTTDLGGALREVVHAPMGEALLLVIGVGLAGDASGGSWTRSPTRRRSRGATRKGSLAGSAVPRGDSGTGHSRSPAFRAGHRLK